MHNRIVPWLRGIAALFLAGALPAVASLIAVPGEPAQGPKQLAPAAQLRIERDVEAQPELRVQVRLPAVSQGELAALRAVNQGGATRAVAKRVAIGLTRAPEYTPVMPSAADLSWIAVPGGYAAQMSVASPQAAALRVSFALAGVPADVQMVFFGSADPSHLVGPVRVGDIADRTAAWWSPVTEGETQTVEIFSPGASDPAALALHAQGVSHLFTGPSSRFEKTTSDIGTAGSCNVDLPCSSLNSSAAFVSAANAVAEMIFNDTRFEYLCTGTLLNDTDPSTQTPWFYSANHCFENDAPPYKTPAQMQTLANTLETLWFFQSSSCNSGVVSSAYRELFGGAAYVYNNPTSDVLFLKLNGTPPAGAFFSGWDASTISAGTAVIDVHHPRGDLKKVSQGMVLGFTTPGAAPASSGINQYVGIQWNSGTTEEGSSGSAILTLGTFAGQSQYLVRGGLWGGAASCTNRTGEDVFSRLDLAYPALAQYLAPANAPAFDYTDLWWSPNESGWGLSITQHASHRIFAAWFTYGPDGKATWYTMPGGTWSSPTTFTGNLFTASGPASNGPFDPGQVVTTQVGSATLSFSDANNGTLAYTVNGVSARKTITRQPF